MVVDQQYNIPGGDGGTEEMDEDQDEEDEEEEDEDENEEDEDEDEDDDAAEEMDEDQDEEDEEEEDEDENEEDEDEDEDDDAAEDGYIEDQVDYQEGEDDDTNSDGGRFSDYDYSEENDIIHMELMYGPIGLRIQEKLEQSRVLHRGYGTDFARRIVLFYLTQQRVDTEASRKRTESMLKCFLTPDELVVHISPTSSISGEMCLIKIILDIYDHHYRRVDYPLFERRKRTLRALTIFYKTLSHQDIRYLHRRMVGFNFRGLRRKEVKQVFTLPMPEQCEALYNNALRELSNTCDGFTTGVLIR
eukprot:TRINITY_DN8452_c1_g1_i1.p1 TRINITY_DN8452_c1_g1~~TRINITY_DN8452_c1_g1_i1.p1  ORF type:complete len:303 (-),score=85.47 TRINITY_DN8452_c1_g1_i1:100-1008(-)